MQAVGRLACFGLKCCQLLVFFMIFKLANTRFFIEYATEIKWTSFLIVVYVYIETNVQVCLNFTGPFSMLQRQDYFGYAWLVSL